MITELRVVGVGEMKNLSSDGRPLYCVAFCTRNGTHFFIAAAYKDYGHRWSFADGTFLDTLHDSTSELVESLARHPAVYIAYEGNTEETADLRDRISAAWVSDTDVPTEALVRLNSNFPGDGMDELFDVREA